MVGYEQNEIDYNTSFNLTGIYGGDGQKMGLWAGAAWQHAYPAAPMMQGAWGGSHEPCGFHMGLNVNMNPARRHFGAVQLEPSALTAGACRLRHLDGQLSAGHP